MDSDGHIPRNARLALAAIDLVQPYVCLQDITNFDSYSLDVAWYGGGGIAVSSTFVSWHKIKTVSPNRMTSGDFKHHSFRDWTSYLSTLESPFDNASHTAARTNSSYRLSFMGRATRACYGDFEHTDGENISSKLSEMIF